MNAKQFGEMLCGMCQQRQSLLCSALVRTKTESSSLRQTSSEWSVTFARLCFASKVFPFADWKIK